MDIEHIEHIGHIETETRESMTKFIVKNIDSVNNTESIIFYIKNLGVNYSENNNGLFLNLSLLNDDIIEGLYRIIIKDKNKEVNDNFYLLNQSMPIEESKKEPVKEDIKDNYKKMKLTPLQINILNYSK